MNGMRKVLCFLMAMGLAAFAMQASAATKSISLSVTPSALTTSTHQVFAVITNTGKSNANSFEVDWSTSPNFVVTSGQVGTDPLVYPTPPGLKGPGYSRLVFLKQVPNKTSVTVTLNVTVTGVNQCAASSLDWWAYAWTGAPGPASQSFTLDPGPYTTTLPSSATCTIAFVNQPKDAFISSTITGSPFQFGRQRR
jgi:hypothetical protein